MFIIYFLLSYFVFASFVLFLVLFGFSPVFKGTLVEKLALFVAGGWFEGLISAVTRVCGERVALALVQCQDYLCFQRNPVLPICYFVIVGALYWVYWRYVFDFLQPAGLPLTHRLYGSATVPLCFLFWALAACSDPGRITTNNLAVWTGVNPACPPLFPPKDCWTCGFPRPARCHHCSTCNACIARHDHHCAWLNSCVGAFNLRWFLAFLFANALMMGYGGVLACAVLYGRLFHAGFLSRRPIDMFTGRPMPMRAHVLRLVLLVCKHMPVAVSLALFLSLAALIVFAFAIYHVWAISSGMTGSERAKLAARKAEARANAAESEDARALFQALQMVSFSEGLYRNWKHALFPTTITAFHPKQS